MRQGVFTPKLKMLWHRDRIDEWMRTGSCVPVMVELDLTNRCNLKCNFCTFEYIQDRSDIDHAFCIRALYDMSEMGVKAINITGGGEPTLHKDFSSIMKFAKRRGMEVGLFTNGMVIDEEVANDIVNNCSWVRVSIDAGRAETFKRIKMVDGFDRVVDSVKRLIDAKKRNSSSCTVGIGFVITQQNFNDIGLFGNLIAETGADYGQFKPEIKNCFSNEQITAVWWKGSVEPLLQDVMEKEPSAVINLYKFNDLCSSIEREYKVCYGHNFVPCIGATGDVWVCTHLRNIEGFSYGNICTQKFTDIWRSDKRKEVCSKIELPKCQKYCRNNEINKVLWALKENKKEGHYNFI